MANQIASPITALTIRRTLAAPREKVFRAWTDPEALKKWFRVAEEYTTPIAEVDLRVGGRYRLGMQAPDGGPVLLVGGTYREISPPERLVFTWRSETADESELETLVTVEFHERGESTELVLTHEGFADEARREQHSAGWQGCLEGLARALPRLE